MVASENVSSATISLATYTAPVSTERNPGELGLLLRLAHQRAREAGAEALRPLEIEGRHVGLLMTLARDGTLSQRELGERLHNDKSAIQRTVDDLERLGLAVRRPVPADRRANAVELTEQGRTRLKEAKIIACRVEEQLLDGLAAAERNQLIELLRRFVLGAAR